MTLREFLAIMRHRWMTIVACALVVLAATAFATLSIPPTYTAHARVFFSAESVEDPETGQQGGVYVLTQSDLNTYIEVLGSPTVQDSIRGELQPPPGAWYSVQATAAGTSSILDITASASSPELAAAAANVAGPQLASVAADFSVLLANSGQTVQSTFIAPATPPSSPSSPDVRRNLTLGLLFGLLLGVGVAFVRHSLDTRVRGESDVQEMSDRPVLAAIPFDKATVLRPLVMEVDPYSPHAEEFRKLRANLMFVDVATASHSFVITSSVAGEGKTTTAVNLALAMADAGAKVLLIDADLRNPSVARTLGIDGDAGLTTMLIGRATFDDVAQRWKDTTLTVLPAGQIPPNPSELLGSNAMQKTFTELSARFDFVLVDSPPVLPVIDALLLNKLTGATLLVVSVDTIRKRFLAQALKALHTASAHVSGFALNMVPTSGSDSYYGYGYGYHQNATAASRPGRRGRRGRRGARTPASAAPAAVRAPAPQTQPPPAPVSASPSATRPETGSPAWVPVGDAARRARR